MPSTTEESAVLNREGARIPVYVGHERGPCGQCGEPIRVDARTCSHCGYAPRKQLLALAGGLVVLGALLTKLLVTAIVGVPMLVVGVVVAIATIFLDPHPAEEPEHVPLSDVVPSEAHQQSMMDMDASETGYVTVTRRSVGSRKMHLVVAVLTIWWSFGLGNVLYAAYRYIWKVEEDVVPRAELERERVRR